MMTKEEIVEAIAAGNTTKLGLALLALCAREPGIEKRRERNRRYYEKKKAARQAAEPAALPDVCDVTQG